MLKRIGTSLHISLSGLLARVAVSYIMCLPLVVIDVSGAVSPDWVRTEREKLETAIQKLTLNPDKKVDQL